MLSVYFPPLQKTTIFAGFALIAQIQNYSLFQWDIRQEFWRRRSPPIGERTATVNRPTKNSLGYAISIDIPFLSWRWDFVYDAPCRLRTGFVGGKLGIQPSVACPSRGKEAAFTNSLLTQFGQEIC